MSRARKNIGMGAVRKTSRQHSDPEINRLVDDIYKELNKLSISVNLKATANTSSHSEGSSGDIRLFKGAGQDGSVGYFIQGKFEDGWGTARLSLEQKNPEVSELGGNTNAAGGIPYSVMSNDVTYELLASNDDVGVGPGQLLPGYNASDSLAVDAHWKSGTLPSSQHNNLHYERIESDETSIITTIAANISKSSGSSEFAARADHVHDLDMPASDIATKKVFMFDDAGYSTEQSSPSGSATSFARSDHAHYLDTTIKYIYYNSSAPSEHLFTIDPAEDDVIIGKSDWASTPVEFKVYGATSITGDTSMAGDLSISGSLNVGWAETVPGDSDLQGNVIMGTQATSSQTVQIWAGTTIGDTTYNDDLTVWGNVTIKETGKSFVIEDGSSNSKFTIASSTGNTVIAGTLTTTGHVDLDSSATIDGLVTMSANATIGTTLGVGSSLTVGTTLGVTGVTTLDNNLLITDGDFTIETDKFSVIGASGNTIIAGTLTAGGHVDLDSSATIDGATIIHGVTTINNGVVINHANETFDIQNEGVSKFTVNTSTGNLLNQGMIQTVGNIQSGASITAGSSITAQTDLTVGTGATIGETLAVTGETTLSDDLNMTMGKLIQWSNLSYVYVIDNELGEVLTLAGKDQITASAPKFEFVGWGGSNDGQLIFISNGTASFTAPETTMTATTSLSTVTPLLNLQSDAINLGAITQGDVTLTFKGGGDPAADGVLWWDQSEDRFVFEDNILINTRTLYFRGTTEYIFSSDSGKLDIDATTEIEINAPTLDIDAATLVDIDSALIEISGDINIEGHIDMASGEKIYWDAGHANHDDYIQGNATKLELKSSESIEITASYDNKSITLSSPTVTIDAHDLTHIDTVTFDIDATTLDIDVEGDTTVNSDTYVNTQVASYSLVAPAVSINGSTTLDVDTATHTLDATTSSTITTPVEAHINSTSFSIDSPAITIDSSGSNETLDIDSYTTTLEGTTFVSTQATHHKINAPLIELLAGAGDINIKATNDNVQNKVTIEAGQLLINSPDTRFQSNAKVLIPSYSSDGTDSYLQFHSNNTELKIYSEINTGGALAIDSLENDDSRITLSAMKTINLRSNKTVFGYKIATIDDPSVYTVNHELQFAAAKNTDGTGGTGYGYITWCSATSEDHFEFADDIRMKESEEITFRDDNLKIYSSADGQLDIHADEELEILTDSLDIDATDLTMNGTGVAAITYPTTTITADTKLGIVTPLIEASGDLDIEGDVLMSQDQKIQWHDIDNTAGEGVWIQGRALGQAQMHGDNLWAMTSGTSGNDGTVGLLAPNIKFGYEGTVDDTATSNSTPVKFTYYGERVNGAGTQAGYMEWRGGEGNFFYNSGNHIRLAAGAYLRLNADDKIIHGTANKLKIQNNGPSGYIQMDTVSLDLNVSSDIRSNQTITFERSDKGIDWEFMEDSGGTAGYIYFTKYSVGGGNQHGFDNDIVIGSSASLEGDFNHWNAHTDNQDYKLNVQLDEKTTGLSSSQAFTFGYSDYKENYSYITCSADLEIAAGDGF